MHVIGPACVLDIIDFGNAHKAHVPEGSQSESTSIENT